MGAETRIAVAEDIVLDFAGLFSPIEGEKQAPGKPHRAAFKGWGI